MYVSFIFSFAKYPPLKCVIRVFDTPTLLNTNQWMIDTFFIVFKVSQKPYRYEGTPPTHPVSTHLEGIISVGLGLIMNYFLLVNKKQKGQRCLE
jgi:hypothetical protein